MNLQPRFSRYLLTIAFASAFTIALDPARAQEAPAPGTHGVLLSNMDRSVKPGDNFFEFANGDWLRRTEIPADRAVISLFTSLDVVSNKRTSGIIEEAAKSSAPAGSEARKIADLYNSYMDEAGIEAKGLAPLRPHLDAVAAIKDKRDLAHALGESLRADVDALNNTNFHTPNLFGLWVAPNFNDVDHYTAYLLQGGVQLPDREYYLADNDHMRLVRTQYQTHVSAMLKLAGFTNTDARAAPPAPSTRILASASVMRCSSGRTTPDVSVLNP